MLQVLPGFRRRDRRPFHAPGNVCRHLPALAVVLIAAGTALLPVGCSSLRFSQRSPLDDAVWPTMGHDNARTCMTAPPLAPPLSREWTFDLAAGVGPGSPLLVDSSVIIGTLRGELFVIDVRTGRRIGSKKFGGAIMGSPASTGSLLAVPLSNSGQSLILIDRATGDRSAYDGFGDIELSPLAFGRHVVFGSVSGTVTCVADSDGTVLWKFAQHGTNGLHGFRASPAATDSLVIFGGENGTVTALSAATGRLLWQSSAGGAIVGGIAVRGQRVCTGTTGNTVEAFSVGSGARLWSAPVDGPVFGAPAIAADTVYVGTLAGSLYAITMNDGSVAWRVDVGGPVNSAPCITGPVIYCGTLNKQLVATDRAAGTVLWTVAVEGRIKTPPVAGYGRLFVATDEQKLICYREQKP